MHADAGALAAGVETGDGRLAPDVGAHTTHHVVGGGGDRDRLLGDVQPVLQAVAIDLREAGAHALRRQVGDVQVDLVRARTCQLCVDGARDDIARRQLGPLVVLRHEAPSGGVHEEAALAAHRLRDKEDRRARQPQGGGVELDELHVHDLRPGPISDGDAIAGGHFGVGAHAVELAAAPRRQHHRPPLERLAGIRAGIEGSDTHGAAVLDQHLLHQAVLLDGDAGHAGEGGE